MIVWGGETFNFTVLNTGGRYCAQSSRNTYSHGLAHSDTHGNSYTYSDAEAFTDAEAAPDSTPPALIMQMIPKLRRKIGYLF